MKIQEVAQKTGGYALKDFNVTRIKKQDIAATIKYVSKLTNIPTKDLHKVGSTGKMATSGDIDLAVDSTKYDPKKIHHNLQEIVPSDFNHGTNIGSYAVPIRGIENKGAVQVDLMFTPDVEWAKFAYHSEGDGSKYKGAVRAILLSAVAASLNKPNMDHFEYDNDQLIIRAGRTIDLSQGLRRVFQYRPKRKDGSGYLKNMKAVPIEDFKSMFPQVNVKGGQVTISDPEKVVKILFGGSATPKDVNTAEHILQLIKRKFSSEEQDKIFSFAAKRAKYLATKMRLPPEIMEKLNVDNDIT